jgi:hypothetical protein
VVALPARFALELRPNQDDVALRIRIHGTLASLAARVEPLSPLEPRVLVVELPDRMFGADQAAAFAAAHALRERFGVAEPRARPPGRYPVDASSAPETGPSPFGCSRSFGGHCLQAVVLGDPREAFGAPSAVLDSWAATPRPRGCTRDHSGASARAASRWSSTTDQLQVGARLLADTYMRHPLVRRRADETLRRR